MVDIKHIHHIAIRRSYIHHRSFCHPHSGVFELRNHLTQRHRRRSSIYIYILYSAIQFQSCCCASPHKIDVLVVNVLHRLLPLMLIVNFCSIHILCVLLCCSDSRSRILFIFFVHFVRYSLITLVCYSIPRSIRQSNTIHSGHFR